MHRMHTAKITTMFWLLELYLTTVMIGEQCSADCCALHGYHSIERSCHMAKASSNS